NRYPYNQERLIQFLLPLSLDQDRPVHLYILRASHRACLATKLLPSHPLRLLRQLPTLLRYQAERSEERRVGKVGRARAARGQGDWDASAHVVSVDRGDE